MYKFFKIILMISFLVSVFFLRYEIINFLNVISEINNKAILIILIAALFFIPFLSTFLILINSIIFNNYAFYLSFILIIFSSAVTFLLFRKLKKKNFINLKLRNNFSNLFRKISKLYVSDYGIFIMRLLIPPFIHNISYSLIDKVRFKNFIVTISLAQLPGVYSITLIGKSIKNFDHIKRPSLDILFEPSFYLPVIFLFILMFFVKLFNKKIIKV